MTVLQGIAQNVEDISLVVSKNISSARLAVVEYIESDILPSGSGFDNGTKIDWERSTSEKVVLTFGFHHMDEMGGYTGWTQHTAIITPSLCFDYHLKITCGKLPKNKKYILEEFHDTLREVLSSELDGTKIGDIFRSYQ